MTHRHLDPDTFRRAEAAFGERFRLLSTPGPGPETAAKIKRIAAAVAERRAALHSPRE